MSTQNAGNPNWSLTLPALADVAPMDPTRTRIPDGPYAGVIVSSEMKAGKEPGSAPVLGFTIRITEPGEANGKETWINMGTDFAKEGNKKAYKALLLSIGAQPAQLGQPVPVGPSTFNGKACFIFIQNPPEGEKDAYTNRNFIAPDLYTKLKQVKAAEGTGGATSHAMPQVGSAVGGMVPGIPQPPANGVGQLGAALGAAPTQGLPGLPTLPGAPAGGTFQLP